MSHPNRSSGTTCCGDLAFLLFGCRSSKGVAVHCHVSSPRVAEASGAGYPFEPLKPLAAGELSEMFFCTGRSPGGGGGGGGKNNGGGGGGDGHAGAGVFFRRDNTAANRSAPKEVSAPEGVESVFCTTCPSKPVTIIKDFSGPSAGSGAKNGGERRSGGRPPLAVKVDAASGSVNKRALLQQQQQQQQLASQLQAKASQRRSSGGTSTPPVSGRVSIAPRRSIDSAAKPAPSPPSAAARKLLPPRLSDSSGGSCGSLTSLVSDEFEGLGGSSGGGAYGGSRRSSTGSTRRSSAGARRRRPTILSADMEEQLQQDAMECTVRAMEESDDHEDIAAAVKKDFDELHGAKWHCIVGKHFGSFVTAESNHFVHLHLGKVAVLLFRAGK